MPDVWQSAADAGKKYFLPVADCIAQCASSFGGGRSDWQDLNLHELIVWTDKAVSAAGGSEE